MRKLEGHVQEHSSYQVCIADLNTTLDDIARELVHLCDAAEDHMRAEDRMQKLQVLSNVLTYYTLGGSMFMTTWLLSTFD